MVETLAQVCVGIATAAFLVGGGAGLVRLGSKRVWRAGALLGVGALLLGLVLRGWAAEPGLRWLPLSGVAHRATLVALVAGLLTVWQSAPPQGRRPSALVLIAIVTGVGVIDRPAVAETVAPLSLCVLVAAGFLLWSAGQALDVLVGDREDNVRAAAIAFAGLTAAAVVVGGVNGRVWGTPSGTVAASLGLWAVWLMSAARLVWRDKSTRLTAVLDLLTVTLMLVIALSVQWAWPFD